jgi:flagellar biosynthesis protein FlhG
MAHFPAARRPIPQPRLAPAPIIAIASGKGGVGKTWLSTTLACLYGRQGKRTLLIDGDLGLANADVQLGVRPQTDIAAVLRGFVAVEAAVTPIYGGPGRSGFDLLSGHSGSGVLANPSDEELTRLLGALGEIAQRYDRVVLDLAAGIDRATMAMARAADRVLVVTTEEPTALTDAYAFIKVFAPQSQARTPLVAVNMADKRLSGRRIYDQLAKACETYLNVRPPLAGIIQRDPAVPDCIRAQTALPMRHATSVALDDAMRVAESLSG